MRGPSQPVLALLILCQLCFAAAAQEKPFNQEEWQRGYDEIMHPKPADPKLEAVKEAKRLKEVACWNDFIEKNATTTITSYQLTEQACRACEKDIIAAGVAEYNARTVTTPLTADKSTSIRDSHDYCKLVAYSKAMDVISDRQWAIKKARDADLKAKYAEKVAPAMACSTQAAKIYALATSETADSIATASFEKCHDLWSEAADFSLNLFPNLSESDRWDALKQGWREHGISAVVDQRARQKIDHPPVVDVPAPDAKQGDTGI